MDIYEKYKIHVINGRRYYEYNVDEKLPLLDNTIPYYFKYNDIEIYDNRWTMMALKIIQELDKRNPKTDDYLLNIKYSWSKTEVFSKIKRTNYTPFRNLYLNTNHTSTHALMSIQCLLRAYDVDPKECYLLINRHPIAEPADVREYIINRERRGFSKSLLARRFSFLKVSKILSNFDVVNKLLAKTSPNFDNFYLFNDYYYFTNYKSKVIEKANLVYQDKPKNIVLVKKYLDYYDDYLKNKKFFQEYDSKAVSLEFEEQIKKEVEFLFSSLKSPVITSSKIYSRIKLLYPTQMNSIKFLDSPKSLFEFLKLNFSGSYYFQEPYISKNPIFGLTTDEIVTNYAYSLDTVSVSKLNDYADKMHIKRISNYLGFIIECSDDYVLVSQGEMKKKSLLDIGESYLAKLSDALSFYINSFGTIDSRTYKGYSSLPNPNIGKPMGKTLLFGIVLSYLKDKFEVESLGGKYTDFEFLIKNVQQ